MQRLGFFFVHSPGLFQRIEHMTGRPRWFYCVVLILLAGAIAGCVAIMVKVWCYTTDDSFITFRYARNLAEGWGLTFNWTAEHVEGYSSVLWTCLMAIPHAAGMSVVTVSKVLGLLFTMAAIIIASLAVYSAERGSSGMARITGAIVTAHISVSFPYCALHAVSGMETALALLLYTSVSALVLSAKDNSPNRWFLPFMCLLLGLTRPEANLFIALILGTVLYGEPSKNRSQYITSCILVYILPGVIYFAWRYYYYGLLFPLPFYVKTGGFGVRGLHYFGDFISDMSASPMALILLSIVYKPKQTVRIVLPLFGMCMYLLTIQHNMMGYGDRYFYPLVPAFAMVGGVGIVRLLAFTSPRYQMLTRAMVIVLMASTFLGGFRKGYHERTTYISYARGLERAHVLLGKVLAGIQWRTKDPVLVIGDAGAVPYYSRLQTVDSFGLNDPFIARHFHESRSEYVLAKKPAIVVLISKYPDRFEPWLRHERSLFESLVSHGFTANAIFPFSDQYYLWAIWDPSGIDGEILDKELFKAAGTSHRLLTQPVD